MLPKGPVSEGGDIVLSWRAPRRVWGTEKAFNKATPRQTNFHRAEEAKRPRCPVVLPSLHRGFLHIPTFSLGLRLSPQALVWPRRGKKQSEPDSCWLLSLRGCQLGVGGGSRSCCSTTGKGVVPGVQQAQLDVCVCAKTGVLRGHKVPQVSGRGGWE